MQIRTLAIKRSFHICSAALREHKTFLMQEAMTSLLLSLVLVSSEGILSSNLTLLEI
jgi:hypothetical protein